jgi:hypothetical protein|tara:strand:- start:461 stop:865 length:405 start_codon:yes stop_codon:yes gene_type:complete
MAFGNLKFDTLTTSDAKNTNTEKSLDTSYIFNGTSKTWNTLDGTGTIGILDSLNIASVTDRATGRYTHTFTANMGNTNYCSTNGSSRNGLFSTTVEGDSSYEAATGSVPTASTNASNAFTDTDAVMIAILGDLA